MPCDGSAGTNDQHAGQPPQHASEDVWDRECDSRPDHSHQGHPGEDRDVRVLRDQEAMSLHALDWANSHLKDLTDPAELEFEFHASVHPMSFSQEFQKWVTVFEKEINMLRRLNFDSMRSSRLDVLEVMCSENSELTKQVLQLSGNAQRLASRRVTFSKHQTECGCSDSSFSERQRVYGTVLNVVHGQCGIS